MTITRRDVQATVILIVFGLIIYWLFTSKRFGLYCQSNLLPHVTLDDYKCVGPPPPSPNVDLGHISFYLELSSKASIKVTNDGVMIKDLGKSLVIHEPVVVVEEQLPQEPDNLLVEQIIRNNYGTLTRATVAALALKIDLSVLFCSTPRYEKLRTLFMLRQGYADTIYRSSCIRKTPSFLALITDHSEMQLQSIWWSTLEGPIENQMSDIINLSYKGDTSDGKWRDQFIRSLVVHDKSKRITPAEMAARLEKIKQPAK